jgi:hypothetical protein
MKENNFIFQQNSSNNLETNKDRFFCLLADKDFIDKENNPRCNTEDNKVLAKIKYKPNGMPKYLIRIDDTKKLFNPTLDLPETKNIKLLHSIGKETTLFKEVNKKAFDFYLMFLKTGNGSWILNAEREDI